MAGMVALTTEQIARVIEWQLSKKSEAGLFWSALMAFMFLTGTRIGEALAAQVFMVCDAQGKLHKQMMLHKAKSTVNASRMVEIDNECDLARVIEQWMELARFKYGRIRPQDYVFAWQCNVRPVGRQSAWRAFTAAYQALFMNNVPHGCHGVRKGAGRSQYRIAKEITGSEITAEMAAQAFFDHSSRDTTVIYLDLARVDDPEMSRRHGAAVNIRDSLYIHTQGQTPDTNNIQLQPSKG